MPAFRSNELVAIREPEGFYQRIRYGTIVCSLDYRRDDIEHTDAGAMVLLCPQFVKPHESIGFIAVSIDRLHKQYSV